MCIIYNVCVCVCILYMYCLWVCGFGRWAFFFTIITLQPIPSGAQVWWWGGGGANNQPTNQLSTHQINLNPKTQPITTNINRCMTPTTQSATTASPSPQTPHTAQAHKPAPQATQPHHYPLIQCPKIYNITKQVCAHIRLFVYHVNRCTTRMGKSATTASSSTTASPSSTTARRTASALTRYGNMHIYTYN